MRQHGTRNKYLLDSCRCNPCIEAAKLYRNAQRLRTGTVKTHITPKEIKIKNCLHCDKEFSGKDPKIYCSLKCSHAYKSQRSEDNVLNSIDGATKNPSIVKRALKKLHGSTCNVCKISEWLDQPVLLILDHIDGNSENWKLENLRLICSNCDAQTSTYKSRNKGNGRHYRRTRYLEGKSF